MDYRVYNDEQYNSMIDHSFKTDKRKIIDTVNLGKTIKVISNNTTRSIRQIRSDKIELL